MKRVLLQVKESQITLSFCEKAAAKQAVGNECARETSARFKELIKAQ